MILPKKSLGQHWLADEQALKEICALADLNSKDVVLEIGPGQGALTKYLVRQAKQVIAVEFDSELAQLLPVRINATNLQVVNQDILKFDFSNLPPGYKIVANIPYYLTSHLFRILTQSTNSPLSAVILTQKEVAERICAGPGQMSVLSVSVQLYFKVRLGLVVPAAAFNPAPKVDSQVVLLNLRPAQLYENLNQKNFFRIVKAGFSNRRKKLRSSLSAGLAIDKTIADELLKIAGIDGNLRAQNLDLPDWHKLYKAYGKLN